VHTYCLRRLAIEDANEATAEVFLVVWRRLDQVPPGDEVLTWLYGVAHNVVRNYRRGSRRYLRLVARVGSMRGPIAEEPAPQVIRSLEQAEVRRALSRLSPQDQELLLLKAWEKLSNREIGDLLGVTHRAVEGRFARALDRLAKVLPSARRRMGARSVGREHGASAGRPQEEQASVFSPSNSARLIGWRPDDRWVPAVSLAGGFRRFHAWLEAAGAVPADPQSEPTDHR